MNALAPWGLSDPVLVWGLNVLLQVTVVTVVCLVTAATARRNAAARHWILCASLLLVMLSPAIALVMQFTGHSLVSVSVMRGTLPDAEAEAERPLAPQGAALPASSPPKTLAETPDVAPFVAPAAREPIVAQSSTTTAMNEGKVKTKPARSSRHDEPEKSQATPGAPPTMNWFGMTLRLVMPPVLLAWLVGAMFRLVRLGVGHWRLASLLRSATVCTNDSLLAALAEVGRALQIRRLPDVVVSPQAPGPISAGLLRPRVVLPEEIIGQITSQQLRDILVHEVAHIARRDQIVVSLQNVAAAIFWLHPLVTAMNRRLAEAREELCDNHVLAATDAPSYSRTLLALAELAQAPRPLPGAVGLFASRWKLERRVAGLLDERRSHTVRATMRAKALVVALSLGLLAAAALGTVTLAIAQTEKSNSANADVSQPKPKAKSADDATIVVRGRVVEPSGRPAAGATVCLPDDVSPEAPTAIADEAGRFEIEFDKAKQTEPSLDEAPWRRAYLYAMKEGFAAEWVSGAELADNPAPTITLKRDLPIRGQALDLEGRPVAHAKLHLWDVHDPYSGSLDGALETLRDSPGKWSAYLNGEMKFLPGRMLKIQPSRGAMERSEEGKPVIVADEQGRFAFRGVGAERLVRMKIEGRNIQSTQITILTRSKIEDRFRRHGVDEQTRRMWESGSALPQVYPADFKHVAEPSRPIRGTVHDRDTGEPLAGILVAGWLRNTKTHSKAITDENGRYELTGLGVEGTFQQFYAGPQDSAASSYLGAEKSQVSFSAASPLTDEETSFHLSRGAIVRGRVTDSQTGAPVKARIAYIAHDLNPHVETLAHKIWPYTNVMTNGEGEFAIAVLPGPGALAATTRLLWGAPDQYRPARPEEFGLPVSDQGWISTANHGMIRAEQYEAAKFIDLKPGESPAELSLTVTPLTNVARVRCVDEQGKPIGSVSVIGHLPTEGDRMLIPRAGLEVGRGDEAYIEIAELNAERRRPVVFFQFEKSVGAALFPGHSQRRPRATDLRRDEDGARLITLKPCGTISGKLIGEKGKPLASAAVRLYLAAGTDPQKTGTQLWEVRADNDGRFKFERVPPGGPYWLVRGGSSSQSLQRDILMPAGQDVRLGVIDISDAQPAKTDSTANRRETSADSMVARKSPPDPSPPQASKPSEPAAKTIIRGTIVDASGKPAAGAFVAAIGFNMDGGETFAETVAGDDGRYELSMQGPTSKTHPESRVIARTKQSAIAWKRLDLGAAESQIDLTVPPQQLIQARLIDIEGNPASNLPVEVNGLGRVRGNVNLEDGIRFKALQPRPRAGLPALATDGQGLLTIPHVPAGYGVFLGVGGTERFAPQDVALNTGMPEQRGEHDGTYRSIVKNIRAGEVATIPLAPAQVFEGVVLLGDTENPAANARVTMWASQQEAGGSMVSVEGKTDEAGRFRLNPKPGVRFGVIAYPPEGTPYHTKRLNDLRWSSGQASKNITLRLPEAVLARGTVVDAASGEPLAGASIQYLPDRVNNPNLTSDIVTGWQSIQKTDAAGAFKIAVAPGPGTLLVHAAQDNYILQVRPSQEVSSGKGGGVRMYAHAFQKIDPKDGQSPVAMKIELQPGATVQGRLTDAKGNPVEEALVVSRLKVSPTSPQWRAFPGKAIGGRFELAGLEEEEAYPVYFVDPKNQLGATAMIGAKGGSPTIALQPCASASARFVRPDGTPIGAGKRLGLYMVVTPGKPKHDFQAARRGEILADEDFVSNVHRGASFTTDENGEITFSTLIPGARYRFVNFVDGTPRVSNEFVAKSGAVHDMGEIEVQINE